MSICNDSLRELSNPGASGSLFFLTNDDEFILKTVMHKEAEFLQKLLPGYYMNLNQNPHTLLPKFFGMFVYQCNQKNIRLTVMNNLLPSDVKMHLKFDLKGSTYKRKVKWMLLLLATLKYSYFHVTTSKGPVMFEYIFVGQQKGTSEVISNVQGLRFYGTFTRGLITGAGNIQRPDNNS